MNVDKEVIWVFAVIGGILFMVWYLIKFDDEVLHFYQYPGRRTYRFSREFVLPFVWRYRAHVTWCYGNYEEFNADKKYYFLWLLHLRIRIRNRKESLHIAKGLGDLLIAVTKKGSIKLIENAKLDLTKIPVSCVPEGTEICFPAQKLFKRYLGNDCIDEDRKLVFPK